ncbi:serine/threonine-protein kinase [Actinomadura bangladeshensis]|uniref:non-specific serine/threonine protein kinase n=1 Tax=Actinomadura bangladeshensis TaxID=453573 RepID=A0A4R4PAI0_9ACTN|nr:serine/threonine-protein kinase [Actinomadura bangladeshensis]TDC17967.1 serine/threonine protein kinase [Actinomadura bangladeshensis]
MTEQTILAGRYRLESLLGRGGMGEVWRARDERLGRAVAVKLLTAPPGAGGRTEPAAAARFRREARIAAGLRHPGIAAVHDFGEDAGRLYLVIDLVDGRDLNAVVADHPGGLPPERVSRLAARIAAALEAAHERGVVHRDIKPANVMVDGRDEITVLDFGIARYADAVTDLTGSAAIGTPAFMAPEQFDGRAPVDARADLYALGALMHALLTGAPPYVADSMPSLLHAIMLSPPPSVRERRPDVPEALDGLIRDLLAKDPADRPASAAEVAARLTGEPAPPEETRPAAPTRIAAPPRRPAAAAAGTRPAAPAGGERTASARTVLRRVFYGAAAVFAVATFNPGHLVFKGGAFDEPPDCRAMAPGDLAGIVPSTSGNDEATACQWAVTQDRNKWLFTLRAVRAAPGAYKSGPRRASDSVRQARKGAPGAQELPLGDGGLLLEDKDTHRTLLFRVSNLVVRLEVGLYGRDELDIEPTADKIAGQLAGRLRDLA